MAEFGVKATNLSTPNTPAYIAPGVVDQSSGMMANTIAGLIPGAVKAYEGTQLMGQRLEQNEAIDQYENFVKEDERVMAVGERRQEVSNIWDQFDSGLEKMDAVNVLEKDYNKNVSLLRKAQEQGKLSDSAFLAKMTSITRAAVTKNPWMEGELYSAAQTHLKAMGITDLLDSRAKAGDAAAKRDEATMKFYREQFSSANMIDQWNPNAGEAVWQGQLQEREVRKRTLDVGNDILAKGKIDDTMQMRRVLDGEGQRFHGIEIEDFTSSLVSQLEAEPQAYDSILGAAKMQAAKRIREYRITLGSAASTPEGKDLITNVEKDYANLVDTITEAGNGKQSTERLKNQLEARRVFQEFQVRDKYNPGMIDISTKILGAFGDSIKSEMRKLGLPALTNAVQSTLDLLDPKNAGEVATNKAVVSGTANGVFNGILKHDKGFTSRDDQLALTQIATTVNQSVASGTIKPDQGLTTINGMLKTVAQNATKISGQPVNPEFSRQVNQSVNTAMSSIVPDLDRTIADMLANPANKGAKIEVDLLPSGHLTISTGNPEADTKFNSKFSAQINNALDSYAAANGMSVPKAAEKFYVQYLGKRGLPPRDEPQSAAQPSTERLNTPAETAPLPPVAEPTPKPIVDKKEVERVGQAANDLIEQRGMNSVEAYRFLSDSYGIPLKDVMNAEHEYRMKNPKKEKKEEVKLEKRSAAEPDFLKSISEAIASLNKPVSIVRDKDGKITGLA